MARWKCVECPNVGLVLRNRSGKFCDTGNCGNRRHVVAYRERRATKGQLRDDATDQRMRETTSFNIAQGEGV